LPLERLSIDDDSNPFPSCDRLRDQPDRVFHYLRIQHYLHHFIEGKGLTPSTLRRSKEEVNVVNYFPPSTFFFFFFLRFSSIIFMLRGMGVLWDNEEDQQYLITTA
jgi:hypothetical protein